MGDIEMDNIMDYLIVQFVCSTVIILIYSTTLVKNRKGTRYSFVTILCVMILISNLATIFMLVTNQKLFVEETGNFFMISLLGISYGV